MKRIASVITAALIVAIGFTATNPASANTGNQNGSFTIVTAEYRAANSPEANKLNGLMDSLYRGKFYSPKGESFRECVIRRESRADYTAANSTSSARGAYQLLDNAWRDSLVWMLLPEAKDHGLTEEVKQLREMSIHKWSRYWQDAAFWTVLNYKGPMSGAKHWGGFGQTYECR
jgi:hypothetical protein